MKPTIYTECPKEYAQQFRKLAIAVIIQAFRDLDDKNQGPHAKHWLETTGVEWLRVFGYDFDKCDMTKRLKAIKTKLL